MAIGDQNKEIDYECEIDHDDIRRRVFVNRIRMINKEPFYGTIAINLRIEEVPENSKVKKIYTDGKAFHYNPWFINALTDDEIIFVLAHEVMHLVLQHLTRKGRKDMNVYWDAADYIINGILVRDSIGKFPEIGGLYNEDYTKMTTEKIYEELKDRQQNDPDNGGDGEGGGNGMGSGNNFDEHLDIEVGDGKGNDPNKIYMTEDEVAELDNDIQASIMNAAAAAQAAGAGNMPAEIERLIQDLTEPKMNWRDFIRENAQSHVRSDYTWRRPNRRFMSAGIIIPGIAVDDHYEFVVGIDASGSMSDEQLRDFLSEIYFISDSFRSFKIGVFTFDTQVYNFKEFDQDTIDELLEYVPKGGGGTDFDCCFNYMKEHDIVPQTFIMLTDGMPWSSWGDEDYCETIFLIHDRHSIQNKVKAPFGTTLYYDDYT